MNDAYNCHGSQMQTVLVLRTRDSIISSIYNMQLVVARGCPFSNDCRKAIKGWNIDRWRGWVPTVDEAESILTVEEAENIDLTRLRISIVEEAEDIDNWQSWEYWRFNINAWNWIIDAQCRQTFTEALAERAAYPGGPVLHSCWKCSFWQQL